MHAVEFSRIRRSRTSPSLGQRRGNFSIVTTSQPVSNRHAGRSRTCVSRLHTAAARRAERAALSSLKWSVTVLAPVAARFRVAPSGEEVVPLDPLASPALRLWGDEGLRYTARCPTPQLMRIPGVSPGMGVAMVATMGYGGLLGGPPLLGFLAQLSGLRLALCLLVLTCLAIAWRSRAVVSARS